MTDQMDIPRGEHPRPDFRRETYASLNGVWRFSYDDEDKGLQQKWYLPGKEFPLAITVPFCYQSRMSGLGSEEAHSILWYRRGFMVPDEMRGKRLLLRFGAVDWACRVFLNGVEVGNHTGGYTPFAVDISLALREGENDLCVRVEDPPDVTQPRGKQYWDSGVMGCWYTPSSGIWQSVYLEAVGDIYLQRLHVRPDIDRHQALVLLSLNRIPDRPVLFTFTLSYEDRFLRTYTLHAREKDIRFPMDMQIDGLIEGILWWTPEEPRLYDLKVSLSLDGVEEDTVNSYFGMRKVELRDGHILLNGRPLYQRLVLDQGYWPDSLLTPPSDEAIREDIEWTKRFGYNGARKHQKIEDPRYYYWADRLGLLVWGELPSAYAFSHDSVRRLSDTMLEFIDRDYNHPCIIAWVPLNESWGVNRILTDANQQAFSRMLYQLCKAADGTRLVSANDGWEQTTTDICAIHDYTASGEDLAIHFASREQVEAIGADVRLAWAFGEVPTGREAFMVTEYGGIAFSVLGAQGSIGGMDTWGYHDKVDSEEAFFARFDSATSAIRALPYCRGYCYTQLTDVMQEVNGLLTPDRKPKVDPDRFAGLNVNPKAR